MAGVDVADLLHRARYWGLRIACAESCTGGLVAAALTDVAGSSDVFDRGFVTYSNAAKVEMLGVSRETLAQHGAVSEPVAREMALGALARSGAGLAVAVTGPVAVATSTVTQNLDGRALISPAVTEIPVLREHVTT